MPAPEAAVAVIALLVSFGLPVALIALILYYKHRRQRLVHETIARLAERGLPVPPELLQAPRGGAPGLRAGLVLVALGVALGAVLGDLGGPWSIALIPGLMGLALLASWAIERRGGR